MQQNGEAKTMGNCAQPKQKRCGRRSNETAAKSLQGPNDRIELYFVFILNFFSKRYK